MAKTPIEELIVTLRTRYGNDNDLANEMILFASMALEEEEQAFIDFGVKAVAKYEIQDPEKPEQSPRQICEELLNKSLV